MGFAVRWAPHMFQGKKLLPSLVYWGVHVCTCARARVRASWGLKFTSTPKLCSLSSQMCLLPTHVMRCVESTSCSEPGHCWVGRWDPWILDLTPWAPCPNRHGDSVASCCLPSSLGNV